MAASVLWSVRFCGLPMPPIGLIAAVHNNLTPSTGDGRRKGGSRERQIRDGRKTGERRKGEE